MGTLTEVEEKWSINDLYDAHEALDVKQEVERYYMDKAKQK